MILKILPFFAKKKLLLNIYYDLILLSLIVDELTKIILFSKRKKLLYKTYRCAINNADRKTENRNASGDLPLIKPRELVLNDADDDIAEGNGSADTQHEEHQEEEHGEELWHHREFRQSFRIRYEGQTCPSAYDTANVVAADLVGEIAQNSEDSRARHQAGTEIQTRHNRAVPAKVFY